MFAACWSPNHRRNSYEPLTHNHKFELLASTSAMAQQADMKELMDMPAACQSSSMGKMMMPEMMPNIMPMEGMSETQKAFHMAMMKMGPAMMQGMMAGDPDISWACSMIPHHKSAIDMSKVVLKTGNSADVKKMAEKIISDQENEIAELTEWLGKQAKRAGN